MFETALLEKHHSIATRRKSATLVSFILQVVLIGVVVIIPLLITQALPTKELTTMLVAPPPPPPPPPPPAGTAVAHTAPVVKVHSVTLNALRTPTSIPKKINTEPEAAAPAAPPAAGAVSGGVPGGVNGGTVGGVLGGILNAPASNLPPKPDVQRVRVSQGVTEGLLVRKVQPEYPPIAKQAHVQGTVVLKAVISKNGNVENVQVTSGSPLLVASAVNAVKQWKYKPYILNGSPVEVETTVSVNFRLAA